MKLEKGQLNFYYATGETPHFYIWTGDPKAEQHDWTHHTTINAGDIVEVYSPKKGLALRIYNWPVDHNALKKQLKTKSYKLLMKALKENWKVEVLKFDI